MGGAGSRTNPDGVGSEVRKSGLVRAERATESAAGGWSGLAVLTQESLDAMPGGFVHVNADGSIRVANKAALSFLGLSYDDISRRYTHDWQPVTFWEDGAPCPVDEYPVTRALVTGEPQRAQTIGVQRPDGEIRWAVFTAFPVNAKDGPPAGVLVSFFDITERKRLDDQRRQTDAMLTSVLNSAPSIIISTDVHGRMTFLNRIADGLEPALRMEDVIGRPLLDFTHPDDAEIVQAAVDRVINNGETVEYESRGQPDLDPNWYATRAGPIRVDGTITGLTMVITLINERKAAELERTNLLAHLHESQRLESLGRLAGGLAHDFNNLITVIRGNVDLVKDRVVGSSIEPALSDIGQAAERAANLTRQLLAFGRRQPLDPRHVPLSTAVTGVSEMLARFLGEQIELVTDLAEDTGWVHADPIQLERIVVNLATNARDALSDGGTLTVRTYAREFEKDDPMTARVPAGRYAVLEVADSGVGIAPSTQEKIFEPFFTTRGAEGGTGLGLATVHGIVKQSGGEITVGSRLGEGSCFTVYLPRVDPPNSSAPSARSATPPLAEMHPGSGQILLVEDERPVREVVRRILELAGYEVVVASSYEEAVAVTDKQLSKIDLLLSDVVMPGRSGMKLAQRLIERRPNLRVVLMSGYSPEDIEQRGVSAESVDFLQKPFTAVSLTEKVQFALSAAGSSVRST